MQYRWIFGLIYDIIMIRLFYMFAWKKHERISEKDKNFGKS